MKNKLNFDSFADLVIKAFPTLLIVAFLILLLTIYSNAQTSNQDFNNFVIANGGDYTYQGNTKAVVAYNKANGTHFHTMWEMYVNNSVANTPVIVNTVATTIEVPTVITDTTTVDIYSIPAIGISTDTIIFDNYHTVNTPLSITFGDTLILGNKPNMDNIIKGKDIIVSDDQFLQELKAKKWVRIGKYKYIRVASKPNFKKSYKSNRTARRSGNKISFGESLSTLGKYIITSKIWGKPISSCYLK